MIKISDYKNKKRLSIIVNDLKNLQIEMVKCLNSLQPFKKYVPAFNTISSLQDNITFIKIHLDKVKNYE